MRKYWSFLKSRIKEVLSDFCKDGLFLTDRKPIGFAGKSGPLVRFARRRGPLKRVDTGEKPRLLRSRSTDGEGREAS